MNDLTENEQKIIQFLREAKPFESVLIKKDAQGIYDRYIIQREQKIILTTIKLST